MAGMFDGLFEKYPRPVDPRETETYDEQKERFEADRFEKAKQWAAREKATFDLYIESLPEEHRERVQRLEAARVVLRRLKPGNTPSVNDLIKVAEYIEYGDTSLVSTELTAQQILGRKS